MTFLIKPLSHLAKAAERLVDSATDYRLFNRRDDWRIGIRTFATYGTSTRVRFRGRVLRDHALSEPTVSDAWYKNLIRTYHALESDEVSGASVEMTFGANRRIVQSDEEGYIDETFELDQSVSPGWHGVTARLVDVPYGQMDDREFVSDCLVPEPNARFGIISDIDDTVLQSDVTRLFRMLWLLIFKNHATRAAIEGTPHLYQSLVTGPTGNDQNPVFYVSSSPWNLQPMLLAFMRRVGLPIGPMMLRDLGIGRDADLGISHGHKEVKIRHLLETYPKLKFVLLGDAGQEDAAIYSRICEAFPSQVLVAYIRQVESMPSDRVVRAVAHAHDRGTPIFLLPGTDSIAADARSRGLIPPHPDSPTADATRAGTAATDPADRTEVPPQIAASAAVTI